MKYLKYGVILIIVLCMATQGVCEEKFKWVRIRFLGTGIGVGGQKDSWDHSLDFDLEFLQQLEKNSTVKPEFKVNIASLEKLEEITKYPILFMHAETEARFNDAEVKNMREYCLSGGVIWADDCVLLGKGDYFFKSFVRVIENKVFPGKKMQLLPPEHEIFHCHFDMPKGLPFCQGVPHGAWGLHDDKGRLMVIAMGTDLHCGWSFKDLWFGEKRTQEAHQMGINIVIYALTH